MGGQAEMSCHCRCSEAVHCRAVSKQTWGQIQMLGINLLNDCRQLFVINFFEKWPFLFFWVKCLQNVKRRMLLSQILDEHKLSFLRKMSRAPLVINYSIRYSFFWVPQNTQRSSWVNFTFPICGKWRNTQIQIYKYTSLGSPLLDVFAEDEDRGRLARQGMRKGTANTFKNASLLSSTSSLLSPSWYMISINIIIK